MIDSQQFEALLRDYQARVNEALEHWLPADNINPTSLHQAMRYAVTGGGKRVRPVLVYATGSVGACVKLYQYMLPMSPS